MEDGTVYKNLDCTPLEETVVTSEEIPEEAQRGYSVFILNGILNAKRIP